MQALAFGEITHDGFGLSLFAPFRDFPQPMNRFFRAVLPLVILGACGYWAWWFIENRPQPETIEAPPVLMRVEATRFQPTSFPVHVRSQGTVQPRTRSALLPEVSARIIEVSPSFRPGGFFSAGDVLLKLDPVDYETAIVVAKAELAQAEVILVEEKAKADQARENWRALGKSGEPSPLALRLPQVAKAEADVASAKARIAKAERDLERTVIRAPYDGQVLEQSADLGQFVSQGTPLGTVFAVDYVEIRLPLPERDMRFLDLPEHFRDGDASGTSAPVKLHSRIGGKPATWEGAIVRVESAIDEATRQITAVAQINDPYGRKRNVGPPLKIGQFVEAEIQGSVLTDVFVIPRRAVRAGNEIILITAENKLRRVTVDPLYSDAQQIVVGTRPGKSPAPGEILCLTPIPFAAEGASVLPTIDGATESPEIASPRQDGASRPPAEKSDRTSS